jgi:hypothetical protein
LKTVAMELGKYRLGLVGVQEFILEKNALKGQKFIHFSLKKRMKVMS